MTVLSQQPHALVIPYPAQGHVMPLMKFSHLLVDRGLRITFVNTEEIHGRLLDSALPDMGKTPSNLHLVSISDGLTIDERKDPFKLADAVNNHLPVQFENLIKHNKFSCVIADETLGWALDVARKMGIPQAAFFPASAGIKAITFHIPKMIEMGVIDDIGTIKKEDTIFLSQTMPGIKPAHLLWNRMAGMASAQMILQSMTRNNEASTCSDWVFCNTFEGLEHGALELVPSLLPIGPLAGINEIGNFWAEDISCTSWLDQQATKSVIYVAFGSITILNQRQFDELALGLEQLSRPFLWVVRSVADLYGRPNATYPDGFLDRVADYGKIVSWAPQQKVLAHPSIACFVSHCGWNSVIEGVSMGVPFICWPYFADQFFNETCITDTWRVGLGLKLDEDGIISRDELKKKVNRLLLDKVIKGNAVRLKELSVKSGGKGGSSFKNLELFIKELRALSV
ncbi:hypothetical protein ACHQM5_006547 [Ranunculus cassubicifolius]